MISKKIGAPAAVLAMLVLTLLPAVAEAGRGGGKPSGGGSTGGATVSLTLLDGNDGVLNYGEQATFTVSTTGTQWVTARCSRDGAVVYTETRGFYTDYPWGQVFTFGPTGMWQGGSASCTAELFTSGRKSNTVLARTAFDVAA